MATLRLFASIREAAGTKSVELPGATVGAVLDQASAEFGPSFSELLPTCRLWVNGEAAVASDAIGDADELAVLPPVSGG